jgi:hypothetical protein
MAMVEWLDLSMSAYWQNRNRAILKQIGKVSDDIIIAEFTQSLVEMFGYQVDLKKELLNTIISVEEVPEKSKLWIKKYFNQLI